MALRDCKSASDSPSFTNHRIQIPRYKEKLIEKYRTPLITRLNLHPDSHRCFDFLVIG